MTSLYSWQSQDEVGKGIPREQAGEVELTLVSRIHGVNVLPPAEVLEPGSDGVLIELQHHAVLHGRTRKEQPRIGEVLTRSHVAADSRVRYSANQRVSKVQSGDAEVLYRINLGTLASGPGGYRFAHVRDTRLVYHPWGKDVSLRQRMVLIGGISHASEIRIDGYVLKTRIAQSGPEKDSVLRREVMIQAPEVLVFIVLVAARVDKVQRPPG